MSELKQHLENLETHLMNIEGQYSLMRVHIQDALKELAQVKGHHFINLELQPQDTVVGQPTEIPLTTTDYPLGALLPLSPQDGGLPTSQKYKEYLLSLTDGPQIQVTGSAAKELSSVLEMYNCQHNWRYTSLMLAGNLKLWQCTECDAYKCGESIAVPVAGADTLTLVKLALGSYAAAISVAE